MEDNRRLIYMSMVTGVVVDVEIVVGETCILYINEVLREGGSSKS